MCVLCVRVKSLLFETLLLAVHLMFSTFYSFCLTPSPAVIVLEVAGMAAAAAAAVKNSVLDQL